MKKTFFIDVGVLLSNPMCVTHFEEHDVCIALGTIKQLENVEKTRVNGERAAARDALRVIAEYAGKELPGGGRLYIDYPTAMDSRTTFNISTGTTTTGGSTIATTPSNPAVWAWLCSTAPNKVLITNSPATQIESSIYQVNCEPYTTERVAPPSAQYRGRDSMTIDSDLINRLYSEKSMLFDDLLCSHLNWTHESVEYEENKYWRLVDAANPTHTAAAKSCNGVMHLVSNSDPIYGVTPRKLGQLFALDALMAPVDEVPLVILKGPAGTAKTFLSLAAGLEQTINRNVYDRILVTRPNIKFDNDIGYLKGTEEDKIGPLIRPIIDNLELLCRGNDAKRGIKDGNYVKYLFEQGLISAQAMAYMRGRSIANTYIIVDEAQNLSPSQAFGIISRVGAGTKVVLAGDPEQIDTPELDSRSNGLSFAAERMRGSKLCAQITFEPDECVRSPLAMDAIKRLVSKTF